MQKSSRGINLSGGEPAALQHWRRRPAAHRRTPRKLPSISSHRVLMILAGVCIIAVFAAAAAAEPRKHAAGAQRSLAVLSIESAVERDQRTAFLLTDTIREEIAKTAVYSVMEQKRMIELIKDKGRSLTVLTCSTKECAIKAGQLLGVQAVVFGALGKISATAYLSLSRVEIETETVEFSVEDKCPGEKKELLLAGAQTARKLMGELAVTLPEATTPENERFFFRKLTAFDKELATVWIRDSGVAGKAMTWEEADQFIQRLNKQGYGGFEDWRLPDKNELATLIVYANKQGKKNNIHDLLKSAGFRNMKADYYWSATIAEDDPGLAWVLDLYGGEISTAPKSGVCYLWPVRTGPWLFEERAGAP